MLTAIERSNVSVPLKGRQPLSARTFPRLAEAGWFLLCLVLFMFLGPFAAPIALGAVLTSQSREERDLLPKPECVE